ncbi:MAG: hypothetical protein J3K34DRAFT_248280 [Monoraphidium minutum]|nr:MAG: hypothetical protein J3K34DRAFT_248280 [Monoraphidium minutum]
MQGSGSGAPNPGGAPPAAGARARVSCVACQAPLPNAPLPWQHPSSFLPFLWVCACRMAAAPSHGCTTELRPSAPQIRTGGVPLRGRPRAGPSARAPARLGAWARPGNATQLGLELSDPRGKRRAPVCKVLTGATPCEFCNSKAARPAFGGRAAACARRGTRSAAAEGGSVPCYMGSKAARFPLSRANAARRRESSQAPALGSIIG